MKTQSKLPEGWQEVELGNKEYFEILSSGIDEFKGEKDYLSTESVQGTSIEKIECKITYENRPSRANMQPILNSIWFAKMKATLKVYSFDETNKEEIKKFILSTGFAGIKVNEERVYPKYLKMFLMSKEFNKEKDSLSTGSTQMGINNEFIAKIKLIIPPISIQKKIVSLLEKAEQAKRKREEADKKTYEYLTSIFFDMFLKKGNKIPFVKLGAVCTKITDGVHSKPVYTSTGIPFISVTNINRERLNFDNCKYISEKDHLLFNKRCNPERGDILYTKVGATYGIASLVDVDREFSLYVSVCLIKPNKNKIDSNFLKCLMNSDFIKRQADKRIKGIGVPDLHLLEIKSFEIPLPPLPLQEKFAKIVEKVEKMKEKQKQSKEKINNLFDALMQKAFRGEL